MQYNKAIRDKIPEIIQKDGYSCNVKTLSDEEFLEYLEKKISEEVTEYQNDKNPEELADILEVIYRVAQLRGVSKEELEKIITDAKLRLIVYGNKYVINRARPEQVDKSIKPIDTSTAQSPAHPAGHAFQAYVLSKKLGEKYPNKKEALDRVARRCDMCRVQAGLHYPSDGLYSKRLVNLLY